MAAYAAPKGCKCGPPGGPGAAPRCEVVGAVRSRGALAAAMRPQGRERASARRARFEIRGGPRQLAHDLRCRSPRALCPAASWWTAARSPFGFWRADPDVRLARGAPSGADFLDRCSAPASPIAARHPCRPPRLPRLAVSARLSARGALGGGHADRASRARPTRAAAPPCAGAAASWWPAPSSPVAAGGPIPDAHGDAGAGRMTHRCPAPLPAARPNPSCRFSPAARPRCRGRRPCDRGPRAAIRAAAPGAVARQQAGGRLFGLPPLLAGRPDVRRAARMADGGIRTALGAQGGAGFPDRCPRQLRAARAEPGVPFPPAVGLRAVAAGRERPSAPAARHRPNHRLIF